MKIVQLDSSKYQLSIKCHICGEVNTFTVPVQGFDKYMLTDICIQDALPTVPAEQREMIMTTTCPKCWDAMFKGV